MNTSTTSAVVRLGLLTAACLAAANRGIGGLAAELVSPVAVPYASGPAFPEGRANGNPPDAEYAAPKALDGDPATFCCLLDDTLGGATTSTIPAKASEPVTGHMVFDLGRAVPVTGARLTGRSPGGAYNPREVDFFYFADDDPSNNPTVDDLEGDADVRPLARGHTFPPLSAGISGDVAWDAVRARYIGMRVNSSYESGGPVHYNFQIGEIALFVDIESEAGGAPGHPASIYVKQETLPRTLLASRRRYNQWYRGLKPPGGRAGAVWGQIRRDFPPENNALLDCAGYQWFEPSGWIAKSQDTELEERLIRRAVEETGPAGKRIEEQL
ncbi:MAG: discoidin domain-containing protein, partial [Planctomycetes bacterium]|nr:discoidin domain-containing protein [Planctomycetota bacterium]